MFAWCVNSKWSIVVCMCEDAVTYNIYDWSQYTVLVMSSLNLIFFVLQSCLSCSSFMSKPELEDKKRTRRKAKLEMLHRFNVRRCAACPIYGSDLIEAMRIVDMVETQPGNFRGSGYVHCLTALKDSHKPDRYWTQTKHLASLIHTPQHYVNELGDIFSRYMCLLMFSSYWCWIKHSKPPVL